MFKYIYIYTHMLCHARENMVSPGKRLTLRKSPTQSDSEILVHTHTHTYIYIHLFYVYIYIYIASLAAKAYGPIHALDPHGQIWAPEKDELPICGREFYNHTARAESD